MIVHAIDKDIYNLDVLKQINKSIRTDLCDLADRSNYQILDSDYDCVVINHAQISSKQDAQFERNNVIATTNLISHLKRNKVSSVIHISSSVVNSKASDAYSRTKTTQEKMVAKAFPDSVILRPTLMFGPLDRKHLGWLAGFMLKSPIFPIPGDGRYIRQPLYVGDFVKL